MRNIDHFAEIAYEAYCKNTGDFSVAYPALPEEQKKAWEQVAETVANEMCDTVTNALTTNLHDALYGE